MILISIGIFLRIISNSYINVFQKFLTNLGQKSALVNFYSYLGLSFFATFFIAEINLSKAIIFYSLIVGLLGCLGNFFIIKALSIGELSTIAPINSYKPIVSLFFGYFLLNEIPSVQAILGIILIIIGTYYIYSNKTINNNFNKQAIYYRFLALLFSGTEAIFIKKLIILSDIKTAFFLWTLAGLLFSGMFLKIMKYKLELKSIKYQFALILMVGIMQYSTNYVFSKMNVSYALALFQLSTLLSVFLGVNIFNEKNLRNKIIGSIIMIIGAVFILIE